ncbi:hypothetical protein F383_35240 [Gossypium arboreum]|uniref:Uncharacterized protein n=1 Tax=Gossypium arboreum TaxID=29729 RepID=A0A0B0N5M3_GOSAR|nr:hypothetical protein F383_36981 [Gossypium arboreum]KHG07977.1 hypothetical protein F383_35240 [Gossypium arboreum]
MPMSQTRSYT